MMVGLPLIRDHVAVPTNTSRISLVGFGTMPATSGVTTGAWCCGSISPSPHAPLRIPVLLGHILEGNHVAVDIPDYPAHKADAVGEVVKLADGHAVARIDGYLHITRRGRNFEGPEIS